MQLSSHHLIAQTLLAAFAVVNLISGFPGTISSAAAQEITPVEQWNRCEIGAECRWTFEVLDRQPIFCESPPIPFGLLNRRDVLFGENGSGGADLLVTSDDGVGNNFSAMSGDLTSENSAVTMSGLYHDFSPGDLEGVVSLATCHLNILSGPNPHNPIEAWPVELSGTCDWREPNLGSRDCRGIDRVRLVRPDPLPEGACELDIQWEANQSVQNGRNSVPLVADKSTYLRIFAFADRNRPECGIGTVPVAVIFDPEGRADLQRVEVPVIDSADRAIGRYRERMDSAGRLWIPAHHRTAGWHTIRAASLADNAVFQCPFGGCDFSMQYHPVPQLDIKYVRVGVQSPSSYVEPFVRDIRVMKRRLKDLYPVDTMSRWTPKRMIVSVPEFARFNQEQRILQLESRLQLMRSNDDCVRANGCFRIYHGVVGDLALAPALADRIIGVDSEGNPVSRGIAGQAELNGDFSWSLNVPEASFPDWGFLRYTHAHEIGHNLGLEHAANYLLGSVSQGEYAPLAVAACGADPEDADTLPADSFADLWPSPGLEAAIGPNPQTDGVTPDQWTYGLRKYIDESGLQFTTQPELVDPETHPALMSYCGSPGFMDNWNWISATNYEELQDAINTRFGELEFVPGPGPIQSYRIIRGYVDTADDSGGFDAFGEVSTPYARSLPEPGDYSLRLLDADGQVLQEIPFAPSTSSYIIQDGSDLREEPRTNATFLVSVDASLPATQVILAHGGSHIAVREASASPPVVQMLYPNGGETLAGNVIVRWEGSDADGDTLSYSVQFSADDGLTWETLDVDVGDTSYELETDLLPGTTQGLVRIKVSDGFTTAQDTSDTTFSIGNHPPFVTLLSPEGNPLLNVQSSISLEAEVEDVEDDLLSLAPAIIWESNLDGVLGTDAALTLPPGRLTPDEHMITVTATDSGGQETSRSTIIRVLPFTYGQADLSVVAETPAGPVDVGALAEVTVTVSNAGPWTATEVYLQPENVSERLVIVDALSSQGSCTASTSGLSCSIGRLESGQSATITLSAIAGEGGFINATVSTGSEDIIDPYLANNRTNIELEAVCTAAFNVRGMWRVEHLSNDNSCGEPTVLDAPAYERVAQVCRDIYVTPYQGTISDSGFAMLSATELAPPEETQETCSGQLSADGSLFDWQCNWAYTNTYDPGLNCTGTDTYVATRDTEPPVFASVPTDITVTADRVGGSIVSYPLPVATDDTDPMPLVRCTPASDLLYPPGTTQVSCTATDGANNSSQTGFAINVVDSVAPILDVPADFSVATTEAAGIAVNYIASATDAIEGTISASCVPAPGSLFAPGLSTVQCTAADSSGNETSASFQITVTYQFVDTDGDGIGNDADPDDDNDGVADTADAFPLDASESVDSDGDGIGNNADPDDDNDGVTDALDAFPLDASESVDSDGDGIGDNADPDDDNDGVTDALDAFPLDASESVDSDGDGIGDNADPDDDNDGVTDALDAFPLDASESVDSDGDGIGNNADPDDDNDGVADTADAFPLDASESVDSDGDGIGNNADPDDDNDGVADTADAFPLDASESVDSDGDGIGNNADPDDDNDGVADTADAFPLDASESVDSDGDGIGNNADPDDDNDGVLDTMDAFPLDASESVDTDGDGIGNNADPDDDNDGVNDALDAFQLDPTEWVDTDGDGIGDNADTNTDSDADGVADSLDQCPATTAGGIVNPASGCSIDQLCPCDGPAEEGKLWYNHGKYVSCVSKSTKVFVKQGLISKVERKVIISAAASSSCGYKHRNGSKKDPSRKRSWSSRKKNAEDDEDDKALLKAH